MVAEIPGIPKGFPPEGKLGENKGKVVEICVFGITKGAIPQWVQRYLYGRKEISNRRALG